MLRQSPNCRALRCHYRRLLLSVAGCLILRRQQVNGMLEIPSPPRFHTVNSKFDQQPVDPVVGDPVRQDMNIGKFCPLPLCNLIGNFRIYLYIVFLVVILSNWVCDNWVYRFPIRGGSFFIYSWSFSAYS